MAAKRSHQRMDRPRIRHQADAREGEDEAGILGRVDQVAGERQADPRAGGHAVDRRDDRQRQLADGPDERVVLRREDGSEGALARAATQVRAAAEATPGAGHDDRPNRIVTARCLERCQQLTAHGRVQGVEAVWPVEGDGRDAVRARDLDALVRVRHAADSTVRPGAAKSPRRWVGCAPQARYAPSPQSHPFLRRKPTAPPSSRQYAPPA